jgi:DNA-binding MarR family transcriptional regulator
MLAIKGLPQDARPTIRELAGRLLLKHHSTVELIDRLERRGAVARTQSSEDAREVLIKLTRTGEALLRRLSIAHHEELDTAGPQLARALKAAIRKSRPGRKAA